MKVLLLGVGMQGKAALHDLAHSSAVTEIVTADLDLAALTAHLATLPDGDRIGREPLDATQPAALAQLFSRQPDLAIDLLPGPLHENVAAAAIEHGVHLINASRATPELRQLDAAARAAGVTILPEFGMDPGIDLVLLGEAVRALDQVEELSSYGAGFPEPAVAGDNPLHYKVTWTFAGVLKSYRRPARVLRDGTIVDIPATEIFRADNVHEIDIPDVGRLEAFANGDAIAYAELLGIEPATLRNLGRYVLRWPGHCALWKTLGDLHLLDEEPLTVDGVPIDRQRFLAAAIEPHIQYGAGERDVVVVRVDATGRRDKQRTRVRLQLVDRRDLDTGHSAMSRTVGYTASIGAQLIGNGRITRRGVLSPAVDVPFATLADELGRRGMRVTMEFMDGTQAPGDRRHGQGR